MPRIKDMIESLTQIAPVVSAIAAIGAFIFSLKSYLRLRANPKLRVGLIDDSLSPDLLTFFRLTVRNDGEKSARDVTVWIWKPIDAGQSITHIESQVEVVEEDSSWKGLFFKRPGQGHEKLWRLKTPMIHPGQEIKVAEVQVHPDWTGWKDTGWTVIVWKIFSADSAEASGKIMIPVGGSGANLWSTKF